MRGLVNRRVGDILLNENDTDIPYEQLLGGLSGIGYRKSMLYLFQGNIQNPGVFDWKMPTSILLTNQLHVTKFLRNTQTSSSVYLKKNLHSQRA